jgi:hypothetical protein
VSRADQPADRPRAVRDDLLALSPQSLAALANVGLVKRAQREIAAGDGPAIEEDAAGVVTGTFKDGVVTRLVPGKTLRETPCSCGAVVVCRHRVAVALAYPAWHVANAAPAAREEQAAAAPAARAEAWSPSCFTDADLDAALGKRVMDRARAAVRAGIVVELDPGEIPAARLPTCAVRFHVPRDLAYARCDCALAAGCEHVALAAWAFREAERLSSNDPPRTVELGGGTARGALDAGALDEAEELALAVIGEGVSALAPDVAPRFARARQKLATAGFVWPGTLVDDLELAVEAYRSQSARYSAAEAAGLLAGIGARTRAIRRARDEGAGVELPARYLLGSDEARETLLDHVRLVSLGARVTADGRARDAAVFLADPDSGVVLVIEKRWTFAENEEPEDGPALARRALASRVTLGMMAGGQIVSRAVKRRANRSLSLGAARGGTTSVTPQRGEWELFPPSIFASDFEELGRALDASPPRLLRPRVLAESMRVVAVAGVGGLSFHPGEQQLTAEIADTNGHTMLLVRRYRRAAPHALEVIAAALAGEPPVRFVAGDVRHGPYGLEIDPVGLVTDRMIVPDLEPAKGGAPPIEAAQARHDSALLAALDAGAGKLEEACHLGLVHLRGEWLARTREAAARLDEVGVAGVAKRLRGVADRVEAIGDPAAPERVRAAAEAWMRAAIRVELTREAAVRG